jgi:hypothetical protein
VGAEKVKQYYVMVHTNQKKMKVKKIDTPLEVVSKEVQRWIDKTEDENAKFPLHAVLEIIKTLSVEEEKFAGKMYDYGASGRYGYTTGRKFYKSEFLGYGKEENNKIEELGVR